MKWEDPPELAIGAASTKWRQISDVLRSREGVWALVAENMSASNATALRRGERSGWTPGEFETTFRAAPGSRTRGSIYARYIGPATTDQEN